MYPGFTWTFDRFSDATAQVKEARIWAGIHFRTACEVGEAVGLEIADYVLDNFMLPLRGHHHHHDDNSSLFPDRHFESHFLEQGRKARIGVKAGEPVLHGDKRHPIRALFIRPLQPFAGLIVVFD